LRLLLVSYPPLSSELGAAQLALSLAAALRERGHEVETWSPEPLPAHSRWYDRWLWQRRRLEEHLARSEPFDAIDAPPIAVSRRVARAAPVIARSVQPDLSYLWCELRAEARRWPPSPRLPLHAAFDLVLSIAVIRGWHRARRVLALGSHERRWLSARFPWLRSKLGHYLCAPSPETRDTLAAVRRTRRRPEGRGVRFLWIGRWAPHKGTRALVRFLRARAASYPDDRFTIAGCGSDAGSDLPESLVAAGRLRLVPTFTRDELPALLAEHDLGLFTSEAEGWGLSISEMIESGMPVAATRTGAVEDLEPLAPDAFLPFPPPRDLSLDDLPVVGDLELYLSKIRWPEIARRYEEELLVPLVKRPGRLDPDDPASPEDEADRSRVG